MQSALKHLLGFVCLSAACAASSSGTQTKSPGLPAAWERLVDGAFENKGIARIERVGQRWALTILCAGPHTTYLDSSSIDLAAYEKGHVQARYRYVERSIPDPKCVAAPCAPILERLIALDKVTPVAATPEQASQIARDCTTP